MTQRYENIIADLQGSSYRGCSKSKYNQKNHDPLGHLNLNFSTYNPPLCEKIHKQDDGEAITVFFIAGIIGIIIAILVNTGVIK